MKIKKLNKKLTLNKKTIASLNNSDMNSVKGGQDADDSGRVAGTYTGPCCSLVDC